MARLEQFPILGRIAGFTRSIDWRRRGVRAGLMLSLLGIAIAIGGYLYEDFRVNDILFTLVTAGTTETELKSSRLVGFVVSTIPLRPQYCHEMALSPGL